jgi:hypothetical protein
MLTTERPSNRPPNNPPNRPHSPPNRSPLPNKPNKSNMSKIRFAPTVVVNEPFICLGNVNDDYKVRGIKNGPYYIYANYTTNIHWNDNNDGTITIYDTSRPSDTIRIDKYHTRDADGNCKEGIRESQGAVNDTEFMQTIRKTFMNNGMHMIERYRHDSYDSRNSHDSEDIFCSTLIIIILIAFIVYMFYNKEIVYSL